MDKSDRKILEDIEQFGCAVMYISAEADLPPFAYSVGIKKTSSAPEVVVIGLKQELSHFIVNEYNRRVRKGEMFYPGERYSGFIEGFEVIFEKVEESFYKDYFGYNLWLYQGSRFDILQLVCPNTIGVWPWQPEASAWFKSWQPILTSCPVAPQGH